MLKKMVDESLAIKIKKDVRLREIGGTNHYCNGDFEHISGYETNYEVDYNGEKWCYTVQCSSSGEVIEKTLNRRFPESMEFLNDGDWYKDTISVYTDIEILQILKSKFIEKLVESCNNDQQTLRLLETYLEDTNFRSVNEFEIKQNFEGSDFYAAELSNILPGEVSISLNGSFKDTKDVLRVVGVR